MVFESPLESLSQVSPRPVDKGLEKRKKGGLPHINTESGFQLNSLGGPLEEDFTRE